MDHTGAEILRELNLPELHIIRLEAFEDENLLRVKPERSIAEYCWTCTPQLLSYCLDTYKLDHCTYLDADLMFFSSVEPLADELEGHSICLTEHYYAPAYDQTKTSGRFCVQYMYFKNNSEGRTALRWWRDRCLEWCFARFEEGKFGDQKYLDDWPARFPGVKVLSHRGAGVAPWNVCQYELVGDEGPIIRHDRQTFPLIFFHFHGLKFYDDGSLELGLYRLSKSAKKLIYGPYVRGLLEAEAEVRSRGFAAEVHGATTPNRPRWYRMSALKRKIRGIANHHSREYFSFR